MKKNIGVGVVGLNMGQSLFPLNMESASGLEVRGVCSDRTKDKALPLLNKWNIPYYTRNYNELLMRDEIDVIAIFSPDKDHFSHASSAVQAGKHVVLTKPFTNTLPEAQKLYRLSNKQNIHFLIGQTMRFEPQFKELYKKFEANEFGRIIVFEAHYLHDMRTMYKLTPWRLQKDWLIGAGNHPIDAVRWFIGEIEEVDAYAVNGGISDYKDIDNFLINLKGTTGILARILLLMGCAESPEPMMKLGVYGSKGGGFATHTDNKGGELRFVIESKEKISSNTKIFQPETGLDPYGHTETVLRYMRYFEKCLVANKKVRPNAEDGYKSILIAECIRKSILEKRPVAINELFSK